jgi:hypothetical protein
MFCNFRLHSSDQFGSEKFKYCVLEWNSDTVHPIVFLMVLMAAAVRIPHNEGNLLIVIERI